MSNQRPLQERLSSHLSAQFQINHDVESGDILNAVRSISATMAAANLDSANVDERFCEIASRALRFSKAANPKPHETAFYEVQRAAFDFLLLERD